MAPGCMSGSASRSAKRYLEIVLPEERMGEKGGYEIAIQGNIAFDAPLIFSPSRYRGLAILPVLFARQFFEEGGRSRRQKAVGNRMLHAD